MQSPNHFPDAPDVPRYLFRAWSPASDGANHHEGFRSLAWANHCFRNDPEVHQLGAHADEDAHHMVKDHVLWRSWNHCRGDILISFTSSLFHVLTHALYKVHSGKQKPATTIENCWITIIDTSKFPRNTFLKTTYLLNHYDIETTGAIWHAYNQGEYLAQYSLHLGKDPEASFTALLACLIHKGQLFTLIPELSTKKSYERLEKFLFQMRCERFCEDREKSWEQRQQDIGEEEQAVMVSPADVLAAHKFALCFSDRFNTVMRIWALNTATRKMDDPVLLYELSTDRYASLDEHFLFKDPGEQLHVSMKDVEGYRRLMKLALCLQRAKNKSL